MKTIKNIREETQIDLLPYFNESTGKWEVEESTVEDETIEIFEFDTEEDALFFIDEWIRIVQYDVDHTT